MGYGKETCTILKGIRQQIADKNEIEYATSECHFQGECQGTCPKCESELQYLERELHKRKQLGKAVAVAGIATVSIGVAMASMTTFSSCDKPTEGIIKRDTIPNHDTIPLDGIVMPAANWYEDSGENL